MKREPTRELCVEKCGSRCCRQPVALTVTRDEAAVMAAARPEVSVSLVLIDEDHAEINFAVNGGACPFLGETGDCTIYESRPGACRRFPERSYDFCLAWSPPRVRSKRGRR